jgi:hypothetical protein
MRKVILTLVIMAICFVAGAQEPAKPQESAPSLEETTRWLQEKISNYGSYSAVVNHTETVGKKTVSMPLDIAYKALNPVFNDCTFTYSYVYADAPVVIHQLVNVIQLGDIDGSKVKLDDKEGPPYFVKLPTVGGEGKIKQDQRCCTARAMASFGTKNVSEAIVPFEDRELAGRVAKAFAHAADLCKKKKEPF